MISTVPHACFLLSCRSPLRQILFAKIYGTATHRIAKFGVFLSLQIISLQTQQPPRTQYRDYLDEAKELLKFQFTYLTSHLFPERSTVSSCAIGSAGPWDVVKRIVHLDGQAVAKSTLMVFLTLAQT